MNLFILDYPDRRPLHMKLYNQLKEQILTEKLPPGAKLPSVRQLAAELAVSRNTVDYAYAQLCTEGFIYSKSRSGYYVSSLEQECKVRPSSPPVGLIRERINAQKNFEFDFHPASLSPESFPDKLWRKLTAESLSEKSEQFTAYCDPQGELDLRLQIQGYLERFRGVSCSPEQIVICSGLQDSLAVIAQLLQAEHASLAVENPGHWLPGTVFQRYAFTVHSVPVQPDGLDLDCLQQTASTVVYITPSHQFPFGYVMPVEKRLKLIQWMEHTGGVIIEDDYDSELRYHGKPIPALQGLYPEGRIIYVGTFAKVLSPALRVSYMVLPDALLPHYHQLFRQYAPAVSLLEQKTLYHFMMQGYWERHLRTMRTRYKRKHDALLQAVQHYFGSRASILGQGAGLHIVLKLIDCPFSEPELIRRAEDQLVRLFPVSETYSGGNPEAHIMLGFGRMNPEQLEKGVARLAHAWLDDKEYCSPE